VVTIPSQVSDIKGGESACRPGSVPRSRGAAIIHLGLLLPTASCGLPASIGRAALDRSRREPLAPLLTLLRVGFTEPPQSPAALVVSYTTVSPLPRRCRRGGLFSVALSRGSPRVGVTDHPALWSPDLPHRACARRDRPADSPVLRILGSLRGASRSTSCSSASRTIASASACISLR
jgi:hypothetical protein